MTFIKHFIGIFILFIVFSPNPCVIANQTNYVPPSLDRYTQQTRSQASRTPTKRPTDFEMLAPGENIPATVSENPVFFLDFYKILGTIPLDITTETP
jgi:hypothetical protein